MQNLIQLYMLAMNIEERMISTYIYLIFTHEVSTLLNVANVCTPMLHLSLNIIKVCKVKVTLKYLAQ